MSQDIITVEAQIVDKAQQAALADAEVVSVLEWMNKATEDADCKKARLGRLLIEVSEKELYRELGFPSFDQWMKNRISRFKSLQRTQLYAHMFTARHLLPHVDEKTFEQIGINKAKVIAEAIKTTGVAPKEEIVRAASNPRVTEGQLRQMVVEAYNLPEDDKPKGRWRDLGQLGAIYAEDEEWAEIRRAVEVAMMTDPVMSAESSDSAKLLDALLKISRDFLAAHEAEVNQ
jgi:hypothetical protein